jgi:hypothetical protein
VRTEFDIYVLRTSMIILNVLWKESLCIRYSTIEAKEAARIGYNGFLFPHEYSGEGRVTDFFLRMSTQVKAEVCSTKAFTWVRIRKKKPVKSNTGNFFCFNNNVSNLYNNSVVEKKNIFLADDPGKL